MTDPVVRERPSLRVLMKEHAASTDRSRPSRLDKLVTAWKGIQAKEPRPELQYKTKDAPGVASIDDGSFFTLAGFHGEPFRGAGYYNNTTWWGGYCAHGNVLFPVWHRAYLWRLEKALQAIEGCGDVMMAFWDETETDPITGQTLPIPDVLLDPTYTFSNGDVIDNPLYSYTFQLPLTDMAGKDNQSTLWDYSKSLGYTTKRYPYSGLDGQNTKKDAEAHNASIPKDKAKGILVDNVQDWLLGKYSPRPAPEGTPIGTYNKYVTCLDAPNYTVFSNTTSAAQWNADIIAKGRKSALVETLEQPHNDIHLAMGGFEGFNSSANQRAGANGDMGENDTAAFDPVFFFHHCHIDRIFWLWQQRHGAVNKLDVFEGYPGTNSTGEQGPIPGVAPNTWLDMDSPLHPFCWPDGDTAGRTLTGKDVANPANLGYRYGSGSLEEQLKAASVASPDIAHAALEVSGVSRASVAGSFTIKTYARKGNDEGGFASAERGDLIHIHSILSRWAVSGCANCQTHLNVRYFIPIHSTSQLGSGTTKVEDMYSHEVVTHQSDQKMSGKQQERKVKAVRHLLK